jgi:hypothetical protein
LISLPVAKVDNDCSGSMADAEEAASVHRKTAALQGGIRLCFEPARSEGVAINEGNLFERTLAAFAGMTKCQKCQYEVISLASGASFLIRE